jgi:hypothetical protein
VPFLEVFSGQSVEEELIGNKFISHFEISLVPAFIEIPTRQRLAITLGHRCLPFIDEGMVPHLVTLAPADDGVNETLLPHSSDDWPPGTPQTVRSRCTSHPTTLKVCVGPVQRVARLVRLSRHG